MIEALKMAIGIFTMYSMYKAESDFRLKYILSAIFGLTIYICLFFTKEF